MKTFIGLFLCSFMLSCESKPKFPNIENSRRLGDGICAKPEKRDLCIEALGSMAAKEKWGAFEGSFFELCKYGGAKCDLAKQLKPGSSPPFSLKAPGDSLFQRHHDNGEESYYFISGR
jgi:hypothetical protein